jgi:hypothetical protein
MHPSNMPGWATICLYTLGVGIGGALLIQHWIHVPLILPWLIFAACPLMHFFMHKHRSDHRQK